MYNGSLAPFSNREHWLIQSPLVDEDGTEITLTDVDLVFYITPTDCPTRALLTASIDNGKITLPTATSFLVTFTPDDVGVLCEGDYRAFLRATIDDETTQVVAGTISVVEGGPAS